MQGAINICWLRRDLRLEDNAALYHALKSGTPVLPLFIFDSNILDELNEADARVEFIHREVLRIQKELNVLGSDIRVYHGTPVDCFKTLLAEFGCS